MQHTKRGRVWDALIFAWLLALVLVPLGRRFPLVFLGALVILGALTAAARSKRRALERRGYRVEYVSPAVLRGAEDEFAIAYHEGPSATYFSGTLGGRGERDQLVLPSRAAWDERVEPFARGRREEIVERIRADPLVTKRIDVVAEG